MPAVAAHPRSRRLGLETATPLVAIAAAREVVDEASRFLGVPLSAHYAPWLALRAKIAFVHSPTFRRGFRHRADGGRDRLYVYLRHWLAAQLHAERPELFRRLPASYATGAELPKPPAQPLRESDPAAPLSPEARQLAGCW